MRGSGVRIRHSAFRGQRARDAIIAGALAALSFAGALAGCGADNAGRADRPGAQQAAAASRTPRQTIVIVDLSGSRAAHMLTEGRRYLDEVINGLDFGDRLVLVEMHQRSPVDDVRRWSDSVPMPPDPSFITTRDRRRAEGVREGARAVVEKFFVPPTGPAPHTDIFSTLQVAGEYVQSAGERATTIVLLSDMFQSANGIEMEGRPDGVPPTMPGRGWVEQRKAAGRLPHLDGVCIGVIGADASTENGKAVQQFWQQYFEAVGAKLEERNYRVLGTGVGGVKC